MWECSADLLQYADGACTRKHGWPKESQPLPGTNSTPVRKNRQTVCSENNKFGKCTELHAWFKSLRFADVIGLSTTGSDIVN